MPPPQRVGEGGRGKPWLLGARGGCGEIIDAVLCLLSLLLQVGSTGLDQQNRQREISCSQFFHLHFLEHPAVLSRTHFWNGRKA